MLLLIGSLPPPVGGVSIHCQRLYLALRSLGFVVKLINPRHVLSNLLLFLWLRSRVNVVHIHVSSPLALSLYVFTALLFTKAEILVTIHSNYTRSRARIAQTLLDLSISYAHRVFVLNPGSYRQVRNLNKATILSSSFIPFRIPVPNTNGDTGLSFLSLTGASKRKKSLSNSFIKQYSKVVSTTAWKLVYENGLELYGISEIVDLSKFLPSVLFVVSDPSGQYFDLAVKKNLRYQNVIYIVEPHGFVDILSFTDLFIRNTSTDGDATSVRESLYMGVPVAASSSVDRPEGCITYAQLSSHLLEGILFGGDDTARITVNPEGGALLSSTPLRPREINILDFYQSTYGHKPSVRQ